MLFSHSGCTIFFSQIIVMHYLYDFIHEASRNILFQLLCVACFFQGKAQVLLLLLLLLLVLEMRWRWYAYILLIIRSSVIFSANVFAMKYCLMFEHVYFFVLVSQTNDAAVFVSNRY